MSIVVGKDSMINDKSVHEVFANDEFRGYNFYQTKFSEESVDSVLEVQSDIIEISFQNGLKLQCSPNSLLMTAQGYKDIESIISKRLFVAYESGDKRLKWTKIIGNNDLGCITCFELNGQINSLIVNSVIVA